MPIARVGVVGAGTMGASISVALITSGYSVRLKDVDANFVKQGVERVDKMLASMADKGKLTDADVQEAKLRLEASPSFDGFSDLDLVIEAVSENIDIKVELFKELEKRTSSKTILATNTSSLPISRIASSIGRPQKVIGLHFFNPAHLMKLVEVVPGLDTDKETVDEALAFGRSLGKFAVQVDECASFLVNRLLGRYMNEALWCVQEESATIEEIDKAACDFAMPLGPLALRDMNGADIGLAVAKFNFNEYGERFEPAPVLEAMVERKLLGQKTGKGFYLYDQTTRKRTSANPEVLELVKANKGIKAFGKSAKFVPMRIFLPMINEAFIALKEHTCAVEDLDHAMMSGLGMRRGPLAIAEEFGLGNCLTMLEELNSIYGERFRPAPLLKRYVWAGRNKIGASTSGTQ